MAAFICFTKRKRVQTGWRAAHSGSLTRRAHRVCPLTAKGTGFINTACLCSLIAQLYFCPLPAQKTGFINTAGWSLFLSFDSQ